MSKGPRTRVRSLRLTDLWSRRRTLPACPLPSVVGRLDSISNSISTSISNNVMVFDGAPLVTAVPRGALDGVTHVPVMAGLSSPPNPSGEVQTSDIKYVLSCAPVFVSDSLMDVKCPSFPNNSTITSAAWLPPPTGTDQLPPGPSVSGAIATNTAQNLATNKRSSLSDTTPPRKRQRISASLAPLLTSSQRDDALSLFLAPPLHAVGTSTASSAVSPVGRSHSPLPPSATLVVPPLTGSSLKRKQHPLPSRHLPSRACKRSSVAPAAPTREYLVTPRISMPGVLLGLSTSDIPGAGLGVFLRHDYVAGTRLATYSGRALTPAELAAPHYDTTYVWSDTNQADLLQKRGLHPLIIDANPKFSPLDWGGMINDGLTRPANVSLVRYRNQVYVTLLTDGTAGEELYLEYGGPYWQDRFPSLPLDTQEEVLLAYGLTRCGHECYTSAELFRLQQDRKVHRRAGHWHLGPPPTSDPPLPLREPPSESLLPWLLGVPPKIAKPTSLSSWLSITPPPPQLCPSLRMSPRLSHSSNLRPGPHHPRPLGPLCLLREIWTLISLVPCHPLPPLPRPLRVAGLPRLLLRPRKLLSGATCGDAMAIGTTKPCVSHSAT